MNKQDDIEEIRASLEEINETLSSVKHGILTVLLFLFLILEIVGAMMVLVSMEGAYEIIPHGVAIKKPLEVFTLLALMVVSLVSTVSFFGKRL